MIKNVEMLRLPFDHTDVHWRVSSSGESARGPYAQVVPYVNAQNVQNRLDEAVRPENWRLTRNIHSVNAGGKPITLYECVLYIRDENGEWIGKSDVAEGTDIESGKGGASDSFKRAAVSWGIARYLYFVNTIYAETSTDKKPGWNYQKGKSAPFWWRPPQNYQDILQGAFLTSMGQGRPEPPKPVQKMAETPPPQPQVVTFDSCYKTISERLRTAEKNGETDVPEKAKSWIDKLRREEKITVIDHQRLSELLEEANGPDRAASNP